MTRQGLHWLIGTLVGAGALMAAFALGFRNSAIGFGACALVSIIVLALRDVLEVSHKLNARQEALQQAADRLGLSFRATAPVNVLGWSTSFQLTSEGMTRQQAVQEMLSPRWASALTPHSKNVVETSSEDAIVAIFDYACDKPGYEDVTMRQTVFAVQSPRLAFSHFALVPASSWNQLAAKFRASDVVHDGYRLITSDADLQARIDEHFFSLLDGTTCLEAGEGFLLLYQKDHLVTPEDLEAWFTTGLEMYAAVAAGIGQPEATVTA